MSKTNNKKTNTTIEFKALYEELLTATNKCQLVDAFNHAGYICTTAKTTTNNTNDLYAQFRHNRCGDVSRIQFAKKVLKVYATEGVKNDLTDLHEDYIVDAVNDGSARKFRIVLPNTEENFNSIFGYFVNAGIVERV